MKTVTQIRSALADCLFLLASAEEQLAYEEDVPHVFMPAEIIEVFASDLFHPKDSNFIAAFSESELKSISRLYGLVCSASDSLVAKKAHSVADALKLTEWRAMMTFAKSLTQDIPQAEQAAAPNRSAAPSLKSESSLRDSEG
jgi:hypothetical protein